VLVTLLVGLIINLIAEGPLQDRASTFSFAANQENILQLFRLIEPLDLAPLARCR
jgi:hypothetical protein